MFSFSLRSVNSVVCIGAHADDVEIGCGGTLLELLRAKPELKVDWVVLSAVGERQVEAQKSFDVWCDKKPNCRLHLLDFEDTHFPSQLRDIKREIAAVASDIDPDIVFTHRREDLHQDHRTTAEVTWNVFRNHCILEYEIAKYEGDLGNPNFYFPLSTDVAEQKVRWLMQEFDSQRVKDWYDSGTFRSLMQIRAIECRAQSGYAEAFHARKVIAGHP